MWLDTKKCVYFKTAQQHALIYASRSRLVLLFFLQICPTNRACDKRGCAVDLH